MNVPGEWSLRVALDTTILAVAEGAEGHARRVAAAELLLKLPRHSTLVPAQALGELAEVLVHNLGRSRESARDAIVSWNDAFPVIGTSPEILLAAADLFATRSVSMWEGFMLSAAIAADCRLLLSLNFTHGFSVNGLTVANPFAEPRHELIDRLLNESDR